MSVFDYKRPFVCEVCKEEHNYLDVRNCAKCNKYWCSEDSENFCSEWAGLSNTWLQDWTCNDCIPLVIADIQEDYENAKAEFLKKYPKPDSKRQKIN